MDLFRHFRNNKTLDEMIRDLNDNLKKFGLEPFEVDFKTSQESGFDDNGEWTKSTFKSNDGTVKIVTFTRSYESEDERVNSNDIGFLEKELGRAIESQNFEKAVKLRDKIQSINKKSEKIETLEHNLKIAIEQQDFEKCIELRDKLNKLKS